MNVAVAASRRILSGIAWVAFGVLAWATFTVLIGGSAAHAEEEPETPLGTLTSLVGSTVEEAASLATPLVTDVVTPVVETAVAPVVQQTAPQVVESAVETVQSTPVVGDAAQPVLDSVAPVMTDTVETVSSPVTDVLQSAPVATITEPVLQTLSGVAGGEVGELLTDLGVTGAVREVAGAVDRTSDLLGGTVEATVPPVLGSLNPPVTPDPPDAPDTAPVSEAPDHAVDSDAPASVRVDDTVVRAASETSTSRISARLFEQLRAAASDPDIAEQDSAVPTRPHDAPQAPPAAPSGTSTAAGSSGGSHSDAARLDDSAADPLRAWKRTLGALDDALPSSPVADADVSPD
ncbi:hypothetical protein GCM10007269_08130 [Microbacterium murale]|uniref:Uncharacterized protein n=1 Tax=Microbacterium murale TaxID=1081040 RepID=A0ABQ1RER5_9MICO|nr:hypothetical protein GCM10007269_08130 [Microbacterium murale]